MRRAWVAGALLVAAISVNACHRRPSPPYEITPQACNAERSREADSSIHIDGRWMNAPYRGDSLVFIVNDREAWRGVYDPCHPSPGHYAAALDHLIPATDSVVSFDIELGADVRARYHLGGKHPVAYVFRTVPPPE